MDEVLIEEKKYISSKRAAEITGYAKDYIGQLCREGRVPARLIGRGWYVLETAIQDHRFGDSDVSQEKTTWDSPRYESSTITEEEIIPAVNRIQKEPEEFLDSKNQSESSQNIQESWKAWFDRFDNATTEASEEQKTEDVTKSIKEEEENTNIPIHTIYRPLPQDLLPRNTVITKKIEEINRVEDRKEGRAVGILTTFVSKAFILLLAVITAVVAIIGSGYLNEYVLSISPARIIAGVSLYNK